MCTGAEAALIGGMGLQTVGGMKQASAERKAGSYQDAITRQRAQREREIAAIQAQRQRDKTDQMSATQRAILATRGGDINSGSALLVQEDLAEEGEYQARLTEAGGDTQAMGLEAEGKLARMRGRSASTATMFRTGTNLLKSTYSNREVFGLA
jgi:hypothetical protein